MAQFPELWNQDETIRGTWPPSKFYDDEVYFRNHKDVPIIHVPLARPTLQTLRELSDGAKLVLQVMCRDELANRGYPIVAVNAGRGRVITIPRCKELVRAGLIFEAGMDFDGRNRLPRYKLKPIAVCLCADMGWIKL